MKKTIKLFGKIIDVVVLVEDGPTDGHPVNREQETETAPSSRAVMPPRRELELPQGARFIIKKRLEASDVDSVQSRFLTPINKGIVQLLTESERVMLLDKIQTLKVTVVDGLQRCFDMSLKKWPSLRKLALNSGWMKLVEDNDLKKGDVIEIWCYRQDGLLRFAMNICERRNVSILQH